MGRNWVGFQAPVRTAPGPRVVVTADVPTSVPDADVVALLTTADGLAAWLAEVDTFTERRGGNLDLRDAEGVFGGSFTLVDVPRRVTLVTERHGEIDIALDLRGSASRLHVTVTCVAPDPAAEAAARERAERVVAALRERCA